MRMWQLSGWFPLFPQNDVVKVEMPDGALLDIARINRDDDGSGITRLVVAK